MDYLARAVLAAKEKHDKKKLENGEIGELFDSDTSVCEPEIKERKLKEGDNIDDSYDEEEEIDYELKVRAKVECKMF